MIAIRADRDVDPGHVDQILKLRVEAFKSRVGTSAQDTDSLSAQESDKP